MAAPLTVSQEAAAIRASTQEMIATLEAVNEKLCRVIEALGASDDTTAAVIAQEAAATAATATPATFATDLIARIQNLKTLPPSPK